MAKRRKKRASRAGLKRNGRLKKGFRFAKGGGGRTIKIKKRR